MDNIKNLNVSLFAGFFDNEPTRRTLKDVINLAMSDSTKNLTLDIRRLRGKANDQSIPVDEALCAKSLADKKKKNLPSFLTNVYCEHGKTRNDIVEFLPLVGFDVDHITEEAVEQLMKAFTTSEYVVIAEPSCSRSGVHFVIMTDAADWLNEKWDGKNTKPYEFVWNQVKDVVERFFGVTVDVKCKNPEHIFGICYDELIYYNETPKALHIDTTKYVEPMKKPATPSLNVSGTYHASIYDVEDRIITKIEESGIHFIRGSRNDFLLRFALACNKYGVSQCETESYCISTFAEADFCENEILSTIRSAYSKTAEHGTFCAVRVNAQQYKKNSNTDNPLIINNGINCEGLYANTQTARNSESGVKDLSFRQTFSDKIPYEDWCDYLKPVIDSMEDAEGRDKMILGVLCVNSGVIPNLYGIYGGYTVYPPLYTIIYGPSASRKGELACCQNIIKPLKDEIVGQYQQEQDAYHKAHAAWEASCGKGMKKADRGEEPKEPEYRSPVIAANSSASATYLSLKANDGWGVMFETEAAVLTQSLLSDYGNYTPGLLAAFHHEPIKMNRVKDNIHFDIDKPRLAVFLTCTELHLSKLFPTFEDGLGTRFLFYGLNRKLEWNNPFKKRDKPLDQIYEEIGQESLKLYHLMKDLGNRQIEFLLKDEQVERFNDFFSDVLVEQFSMLGDGITSFVFRLGIIAYRITMVLSILRRYSERNKGKPLFVDNKQAFICNDKDFEIAMTIINTMVSHTAMIYASLIKEEAMCNKALVQLSNSERTLFNALGMEFTTDDVRIAARNNNINEETARGYTCKFIKIPIIKRIKNGHYVKIVNS